MQSRSLATLLRHGKLARAVTFPVVLATNSWSCFIHVSALDDEGDGGGSTTGSPDAACHVEGTCNGVRVWCQNHNEGADESGGEENYWWVKYDENVYGTLPEEIPLCVPSVGEENNLCCVPTCCENQLDYDCIVIKERNQGGPPPPLGLGNTIYPNAVKVCLGFDAPATSLDPIADWMTGSYPAFASEIRTECSNLCANFDASPGGQPAPPACEDENWSALRTAPNWDPADGFDCLAPVELHVDDPDGSEIPWDEVGGPTYPVPLDCDLDGDCVDWFYPNVAAHVLTPGIATFIEPETRHADYLAIEGTTGSSVAIDVDMPGSAAGIDDSGPLFGLAEYSAIDCSDDVCPFSSRTSRLQHKQ